MQIERSTPSETASGAAMIVDPAVLRKRRRRRRWAIVLLSPLVLLFAAWVVGYVIHWRDRAAVIAEIRAAGGQVTWEEYINANYPPADALGNEFEEVLSRYVRGEGYPTAETRDVLEKVHWAVGIYPEVECELQLAKPILEIVQRAETFDPKSIRWTSDSMRADLMTVPMATRDVMRLLRMEQIDALARGDAGRVYRAVRLSFAVSRLAGGAPAAVGRLYASAEFAQARALLEQALNNLRPSPQDLDALDGLLGRMYAEFSSKPIVEGESAFQFSALEHRESLESFLDPEDPLRFLGGQTNTQPGILFLQYRYRDAVMSPLGLPAIYRAQTALLRRFRKVREWIDKPLQASADERRRNDEAAAAEPKLRWGSNQAGWYEDIIPKMYTHGVEFRRKMLLTRWTLRVAQFHSRHGRLPATLEEICDESMTTVNTPWLQNVAPIYTPNADGFTVELPDEILDGYERNGKNALGFSMTIAFPTAPSNRVRGKSIR